MSAIDRWLNWHPSDEKFKDAPGCEPTKPTEPPFVSFGGSTSGQTQSFSDRPPDAPDAWQEDFIRWALERCALREEHEDSAGIGCLLVDFAEWCAAHDAVPCTRATFELLLQDAGLPLKDGLARGMVLKVDLKSALQLPAAPEASGPPARTVVLKRRNVKAGFRPVRGGA